MAFGQNPMFDAGLFSGDRVRILCDITGGEDFAAARRSASTTMPLSTSNPAASARDVRGETPTPSTTMAASTDLPSLNSTRSLWIAFGEVLKTNFTPCCSCSF